MGPRGALMDELFDLTGQTALVTGASAGIGRRIALLLARRGAAVAVAARRSDRLADLVVEIEAGGGRAVALTLDVSDTGSFPAMIDQVEQALGPIGILVNNAGIAKRERALKATAETFDAVIGTNLRGPYFLAIEVARRMIARNAAGQIINVASSSGLRVIRGFSAYSISKAALIHMTKALALEWAEQQINVNVICPGHILSEITEHDADTDVARRMRESLPRKRMGVPQDLDCMILALASPANRFTTGAVIAVDDGIAIS
jgi:NAD(P)-dependent dehydrogenase (short-subunit alcohol dehydrogenase family)